MYGFSLVVGFLTAQGFIFTENFERAKGAVEIILKKHPKVAASFTLAADLENALGNFEKAISYMKKAKKLAPYDPAIRLAYQRLVAVR